MKKSMAASASGVALALVLLVWVQASADEVVLKKGQRVKGTVVEADAAKVVIEIAAGKQMTFPRAEVAEIITAQSEELAKADKLVKAGEMDAAQKTLEAVVKSGGIMKSEAEVKLMQCCFAAGQWEKGAQLYFKLLSAGAGEDVAFGFPWQGVSAEQSGAIVKGMAAAGELTGAAAGVGEVVKAWAKCAPDPKADPKSALAAALASKEALVSNTAAVAQMQLMCQGKDYDGCLAFIEKQLPKLEGPAQAWGVYWKGRCLVEKGDLDRAALAFLRVGWQSSASNMLAGDSLFMAAACFEKKRQNDRAADLYHEIAQEHPLAMSAGEARKKGGNQ